MKSWIAAGIALLVVGCGHEEVPTCQQALTHYYEAGCSYYNLDTGAPIPVSEMISSCREALSAAPASCEDDLDDWLVCLGGVDAPASTDADCDCSAEQESLLTCE